MWPCIVRQSIVNWIQVDSLVLAIYLNSSDICLSYDIVAFIICENWAGSEQGTKLTINRPLLAS